MFAAAFASSSRDLARFCFTTLALAGLDDGAGVVLRAGIAGLGVAGAAAVWRVEARPRSEMVRRRPAKSVWLMVVLSYTVMAWAKTRPARGSGAGADATGQHGPERDQAGATQRRSSLTLAAGIRSCTRWRGTWSWRPCSRSTASPRS